MTDDLELTPVSGLRLTWDCQAVPDYANDTGAADPAWSLREPLARDVAALRVLTAALPDGTLLLVAGARPEGAEAHDAEALSGLLVEPGSDPRPVERVLVSTEYAQDGSIRRLGLEFFLPGEDFPLRAAGDPVGQGSSDGEVGRRDFVRLRFRLDGGEGSAVHELVRPA